MNEIDLENYIKEEKHQIFLKRKSLDEALFVGSDNPDSPTALRIDEIQPGQWTAVKGRHIDHNDVLLYASCGDRNKAHLSPEFAKESPFREIIAHGMIAVFKQRLLGRRILPGGNFVLASQAKTFTAPVYVSTSMLDFYEIVVNVDREKHQVTTVGLSVLNNEYDKIVLKTKSVYVPSAIFGVEEESEPEEEVLAALNNVDPALETRFEEDGIPNHFTYDYFKPGLWAKMSPELRMNHIYALAGIGHMDEKLHLFDELYGTPDFLLPCADDAFRSAVLGTLLPAMGSIYQSEKTRLIRPLQLGRVDSWVVLDTVDESSKALSMGLSAYTTQKGALMSSSKTRIYFPKPMT
ncbi:MAG: hypothetical protein GY703_06700 [Gammaproteobacteria bacterium]|nr:hypothetical protein [Gammaproteobacteria bacterium]